MNPEVKLTPIQQSEELQRLQDEHEAYELSLTDVSLENWTPNLSVWPGWIGSLEMNPDPMIRSRKRYKEEQIIYVLRQVDGGRKIAEVCRAMLWKNTA